jgi:hypothetical protein
MSGDTLRNARNGHLRVSSVDSSAKKPRILLQLGHYRHQRNPKDIKFSVHRVILSALDPNATLFEPNNRPARHIDQTAMLRVVLHHRWWALNHLPLFENNRTVTTAGSPPAFDNILTTWQCVCLRFG